MTDDKMPKTMTLESFNQLVGSYGAEAHRWPDDHRAAMQDFLQSQPSAQATMGREGKLDEWLDRRLEPASDGLQARLMADMREQLSAIEASDAPKQMPAPSLTRRDYISAALPLAACFLAGIIFAPDALDLVLGGPDILASLDLFADELPPN
jgi:hypothetical protein